MTIASMLILSPRASQWRSALNWTQSLVGELEGHRALEEDYSLKLLYMPDTYVPELCIPTTVWNSVDKEICELLPRVAERFPVLAVWQICSISEEAEHLINDMSRVASLRDFYHDKCLVTGHITSSHPLSYAPDAALTSWGVPVSGLSEMF